MSEVTIYINWQLLGIYSQELHELQEYFKVVLREM